MTGEERMAGRPRWGRYPVPWFVSLKTKDGDWEWRVIEGDRVIQALQERLCWICGQELDSERMWFLVGPMCVVNRVSAEPPMHEECCRYSVTICPFLLDEERERRRMEEIEHLQDQHMIARNPGVTALYQTRRLQLIDAGDRYILKMDAPLSVEWFAAGRIATIEEVHESFDAGLPTLAKLADEEGLDSRAELNRLVTEARRWLPQVLE